MLDLIKKIVKLSSKFKAHQKWFAFEIASDYIPLLQTRLQSLYHSLPPSSTSTCDACAMLLVAKKVIEKQKKATNFYIQYDQFYPSFGKYTGIHPIWK